MDKYIFEQFITYIEAKDAPNFFKYLLLNAQEKIDTKNKRYLQYYPQSKKGIKLIVETTKDKNGKLNVDGFRFHHITKKYWEFKIIKDMKSFPNTYLVKRMNDKGTSCIRVVNEEVAGLLKPETTIKGEVCGIVMNAAIYNTEEEYRQTIPVNSEGKKTIIVDGTLIPYNLLINNAASLTEEERNNRDHRRDNLLKFKSKIKDLKEKEINMFDMNLPNYYIATIDTSYGELDIIIPHSIANQPNSKIKKNSIIVGELLLSCDLCIDKDKVKKNKEKK